MDRTIVVALITAGASLIIATVSQVGTRRNQTKLAELHKSLEAQRQQATKQLEQHKLEVTGELDRQKLMLDSQLQDERATRDARREYEYKARVRLYEECEPLLFEAVELVELARNRVHSLARSAAHRDLRPDGTGWLATPGYYFLSTAFFLLAPATTYKILRRRLTAIDLTLAQELQVQYELLKLCFYSFADDFGLARSEVEPLPYDPDKADPGGRNYQGLRRDQPGKYGRQGLSLGGLDVLIEALITEPNDAPRCVSFGEFLTAWGDASSPIGPMTGHVTELFGGFHPSRKPVLWRVLAYQELLYGTFLQAQRSGQFRIRDLRTFAAAAEEQALASLDWRSDAEGLNGEAVAQPVRAASLHLKERLDGLDDRVGGAR